MRISKRLEAVAKLVTPGNAVADVGCDHARTSIYLVKKNISPYIIAMDLNKGPLEKAVENINYFKLSNNIITRLSDGIQELKENEVDTILMAGMGGNLMMKILSEKLSLVLKTKELVLQPQSEIYGVRKMLVDIGFIIVEENMIKEDGKYYVMMKALNKNNLIKESADLNKFDSYHLLELEDYYYGRQLIRNKNLVLLEFLTAEYKKRMIILEKIKTITSKESLVRKEEVISEMQIIKRGLDRFTKV